MQSMTEMNHGSTLCVGIHGRRRLFPVTPAHHPLHYHVEHGKDTGQQSMRKRGLGSAGIGLL